MDAQIDVFLAQYHEKVYVSAMRIRKLLFNLLPDITEQLDIPEKMIAFVYGQRYIDMICTLSLQKKY